MNRNAKSWRDTWRGNMTKKCMNGRRSVPNGQCISHNDTPLKNVVNFLRGHRSNNSQTEINLYHLSPTTGHTSCRNVAIQQLLWSLAHYGPYRLDGQHHTSAQDVMIVFIVVLVVF